MGVSLSSDEVNEEAEKYKQAVNKMGGIFMYRYVILRTFLTLFFDFEIFFNLHFFGFSDLLDHTLQIGCYPSYLHLKKKMTKH